jgi:hypothetical protein
MTTKKIARSLFKDTLLIVMLIAPVTGSAVFLWGVKVKDQLSSTRESHALAHSAIEGFISRDVDDLETQLETSLQKEPFLPGDFRFRKEGSAIKATHTSRPEQPLTIELDGDMPFSKPLNQIKGQSFVLVTKSSEILSYSALAKKEAFGTISDAKFMNTESGRPLVLSNFDTARVGLLSTSKFLTERPRFLFMHTPVAKSNLVLFSYLDLRPLWKQAVTSLGLILAATVTALIAGFAALFFARSRQEKNHAWLQGVFESLRFGRLDPESPENSTRQASSEFYSQVQESLGKNTSLRRFLQTDWLDVSRSSVSWNFFKQTLAHWSEGLSSDNTEAPKRWYLGSCRVRSPEMVEAFQRAFTYEFGDRSVRIYQSGETEFSFVTRDFEIAPCLEKIKTVLRAASDGARLTTNDFAMSAVLVSGPVPGESQKILSQTQARARNNFSRGLHLLVETCVELRHYQTGTELCTFGLSDSRLGDVATTAEASPAITRPAFPKRKPVPKSDLRSDSAVTGPGEKTRPNLPPPPPLRTKNLRSPANAGKGFVRITDALGKSEWIEISPQRAPNAPEAQKSNEK